MKKLNRKSALVLFIKMTLLAFAALGETTSTAQAQSIVGKFALHSDTRWGNKTLPAGLYRYSIEPIGASRQTVSDIGSGYQTVLVAVRPEKGGRANMILGIATSLGSHPNVANGLGIDATPDGRAIRTMSLGDLGVVIDFTSSKPKEVVVARARQTDHPAAPSTRGN